MLAFCLNTSACSCVQLVPHEFKSCLMEKQACLEYTDWQNFRTVSPSCMKFLIMNTSKCSQDWDSCEYLLPAIISGDIIVYMEYSNNPQLVPALNFCLVLAVVTVYSMPYEFTHVWWRYKHACLENTDWQNSRSLARYCIVWSFSSWIPVKCCL